MTPDQVMMLALAAMMTLGTAWAAWVSKALITILAELQGNAHRLDTLEGDVADHETRIRGLEAT